MANLETEPEGSQDTDEVEITNLDYPVMPTRRPQLTPRQRKLSLLLTSVLFVLVVGSLLANTAEVRGLVTRTFFQSSTPAVSQGLAIYVRGNPSWGQFTLDGKPLAHPPAIGKDHPLSLAPGRHTIVWRAEPFNPRTCVFTVVDTATINGPCFHDPEVATGYLPNVAAMIFTFFASLNDLPANQRTSLVQQLQTTFATYGSSAQVSPGEVYAASEQEIKAEPSLCHMVTQLALCYARASQPLVATLSLQVDTSTSPTDPCVQSGPCATNQQDCRALCQDPLLNYPGQFPVEPAGWNVAAILQPLWSYTTLSGQVIGRDQPASALRGSSGYQMASLSINRNDQGWLISPSHNPPNFPGSFSQDPLCSQGEQDTMELIDFSSGSGGPNRYVQQTLGKDAAGCLEVVQPIPPEVSGSPTPRPGTASQPVAYYLARFGVVLAVNDAAHQLLPFLPVADASEKRIAQQFLATLPATPSQ